MTVVEHTTMDFSRMREAAARLKGSADPADAEEFAWGIAEVVCTSFGNEAVAALKAFQLFKLLNEEEAPEDLIPNPFFVVNGHGGRSRRTKKYLSDSGLKNFGSAVLGAVGAAGSIVTQVDVVGIGQHSNALYTTGRHLYRLRDLSKGYKQSETLTKWVQACIRAKQLKAAVRGASLASAAVPVSAVQMVAGAATAVGKLGIKLTYGKVIARTAMEIHWRANVESKLGAMLASRSGVTEVKGPQGPASAMMYEIFKRRGIRFGGQYKVGDMIAEPAGWLALNNQLIQM